MHVNEVTVHKYNGDICCMKIYKRWLHRDLDIDNVKNGSFYKNVYELLLTMTIISKRITFFLGEKMLIGISEWYMCVHFVCYK
jgi:hypothetical protein